MILQSNDWVRDSRGYGQTQHEAKGRQVQQLQLGAVLIWRTVFIKEVTTTRTVLESSSMSIGGDGGGREERMARVLRPTHM